jgi:anti-sigma-K factor RskA
VNAIDDPAERDRFEHHLRRCRHCTGEVRGLTETATRLALAAAQRPPQPMRSRLLAAIGRTRQLPPAAIGHHSRNRWPGLVARPGWLVAAVSVAAAAVLVVAQVHAQHQLEQARSRAAAVAAVLAAPDARAVTQATSAGGTATVVFSLRRHSMIFTSAGLPALPSGKVYELWLLGPPRVRPAGLLASAVAGRSGPVLSRGLRHGDEVGLTVEPDGGTRVPTTKPILVIKLPS